MDNWMELTFPSLSINEGFARSATAAFAALLDPTIDELSDLRTAVSEAVTNAIIHAYGNDRWAMITLRCEAEGKKLKVTVKDTGCGIADIELARRLEASVEDITAALASRESALSLDAPTDEDGGDLQAFLGSADANTEQDALRRTELRELFALLTERERQVLFLRYFRDQTQSEVGRRLGLSQVQISRIEKKALLRMRQQGDKA